MKSPANACSRIAASAMAIAVAVTTIQVNVARAETTILAGMVAHGPPQWPQYVAENLGCFKDAGLGVELIATGATSAQQLAVGAVAISHSGFPDFMRATNQGAPVKIVVNDIVVPPYSVHAKPSIKSIADLKGKTIIIGGVKDVTLIYMKAFIASAGLKPSDVDFVFAKSALDRFTALASGGVDAAILNPPSSSRANALGFANLGDVVDHTGTFPFTVWAANTDWAAKNGAALTSFARCYQSAVKWLYDPANKAKALEILIAAAKTSPKDAAEAYDYLIAKLHVFSQTGALPAEDFAKMTAGLVGIGDMKEPTPPVSTFYDPTFVSEHN